MFLCTSQVCSCSTLTSQYDLSQLPSSEHSTAEQGSVGRVYASGTPEMSQNIQQYDKRHFIRVDEAHRCRVNSAMFMPLYSSSPRQRPFAVFEVVQADADVMFPVLVHWLTQCLQVSLLPYMLPVCASASASKCRCLTSAFEIYIKLVSTILCSMITSA